MTDPVRLARRPPVSLAPGRPPRPQSPTIRALMEAPAIDPTIDAEPPPPLDAVIRARVQAALATDPPPRRLLYTFTKRAIDLAVASVLLVVTSPIIAVLSVIIRAQSRGPAIFKQQRIGRGGEMIEFHKFRTMYADAKERFPELYDYTFTEEQFRTSYYKPSFDPRNTPFGRRLRKTTLDELPNLINVFRGDVSLVGPRPELPELVQYYTPEQLAKFSVKSGITGLAQVSGRNNLSIQEQIQLDLEYVANRSLRYDLHLLVRTLVTVVNRVGAE